MINSLIRQILHTFSQSAYVGYTATPLANIYIHSKAATKLERLTPVEGTGDSPGTRFWHRCANSDRPVDAAEGFPLLPVYGMETWHDTEYLCLEEALRNPRHKRLAPSEQARVQALIRKRGST